jgi:hypothetical protein
LVHAAALRLPTAKFHEAGAKRGAKALIFYGDRENGEVFIQRCSSFE